jgi:hypothetical protein
LQPGSYWTGGPLGADDVARLAEAAGVPMVPSANTYAAAEALNVGVNDFLLAEQGAASPGEFRDWFREIAVSSVSLLDLFGGLGAPDERDQAKRNFLDRPVSCREAGFDPARLAQLLACIEQLCMTATVMAAREQAKIIGHRKRGTNLLHIAHGARLAWRILTAGDDPGFGRAGEASQSRTLRGPFIGFTATALGAAADRLGGGIAPTERARLAAIGAVRKAGATPESVARLHKIWKEAGGPARWAALGVGE